MKICSISLILLLSLIQLSFGQSATTVTTKMDTHSISNWKKNLKIRYFGEFLGSNLEKWEDNQYDFEGNRTTTPVSLWNLFNVQYKVTNTTSLLVSPRFFTQIGDRGELRDTDDQHVVVPDDWQFGIVQQIYRNSWVNYAGRLTHRHPISLASKNSQIDSQIEYQNDILILPTPALSILLWNTYRYYLYEEDKNENRYRINFTTLFNYNFNDKWRAQLMHDFDLQHRAPKDGPGKKQWNHFEKYKNTLAFGIGYSPIKEFTFIPFVKALNDEDIRLSTMQWGVWMLGSVF